jgi:hypothetical protein
MKLMLWTKDEGFTDGEFRDGDIFQVWPDDWEPGNKEKQRFLIVQMPDFAGDQQELVSSEYTTGPGEEPIIRRMRKYRVDYAAKLDPEQLAAAKDPAQTVEPIVGVFGLADIARK